MRPSVVMSLLFGPFCHCRTLSGGSLNWIVCGIDGFAIWGKMRSKLRGNGHDQTRYG